MKKYLKCLDCGYETNEMYHKTSDYEFGYYPNCECDGLDMFRRIDESKDYRDYQGKSYYELKKIGFPGC